MDDEKEQRRKNLKVIQFDKNAEDLIESEKPTVTFADVGGLEEIKKKIRMNFILPLKQPELFAAYGRQAGGSLLLYGPPGCGKTFLARAVAGEISATFLHLELQAILSMYVGGSEHNLHDIFEKARAEAPCVLFIDELDALGGSRQGMRQHHDRMLVNQLLIELDGLASFNENVFIIGATNTPWYLDSALRRPGRFNNLLFVPPPEAEERSTILDLKLAGKPAGGLNVNKLAEGTSLFSGADLEQLVRDATELALERAMETGEIQPLADTDFRRVLKSRQPSTLDWFATARNYATFSDTNGEYAQVLEYIKKHKIR
ncbi:ATP-binding protein [Saccharibacillus alkalitolerans]|uniref:ATP-binding protein n=1 Tax=Saccharibacillus alkalitolerans TaxID=2705290 RepID=A0ABX0FBP9_9BACL|nr:ATP-binding protein [Saccharibacillus alkalitolerans]NGZ77479.1 ATP-binding protein [Saccharibacillus alkalitolerans]